MDAKIMFCDFSEVSGGKLFITGAGVSLVAAPSPVPPFGFNGSLAMLLSVPFTETDMEHFLTVELVSKLENGLERIALTAPAPELTPADQGKIVTRFSAARAPGLDEGDEILIPMSLPIQNFPLPRVGHYYFSLAIDEVEMDRASFRVLVQEPDHEHGPGEDHAHEH